MVIVAVIWNIVFISAIWETVAKAKQIGFINLRFMTGSAMTAFVLILVGLALGSSMSIAVWYSLETGHALEFCRRCVKSDFSASSSPIAYWITVVAQIELALAMFFAALLGSNSVRFIRGNR